MFIKNENWHRSPEIDYNAKDGSITYKECKNHLFNKWLIGCKSSYDHTHGGRDASVFFGLSVITIMTAIILILFSFWGPMGDTGMLAILICYLLVGICAIIGCNCSQYVYIPILAAAAMFWFCMYEIPEIVPKHLETCEDGKFILNRGKQDSEHNCIFEGYIINHLDKLK